MTFKGNSRPYILFESSRAAVQGSDNPNNLTYPHGSVQIFPSSNEIAGYNKERQDSIIGPNKAAKFAGYFWARLDQDIEEWGIASNGDGSIYPGHASSSGEQVSAYVRFKESVTTVNVRVGVSFISVYQARKNLEKEIPDGQTLEETARQTRQAWAEKLDRVTIEGPGITEEEKSIFYTGVFHTLQVSIITFEIADTQSHASGISILMSKVRTGNITRGMMILRTRASLIPGILSGLVYTPST